MPLYDRPDDQAKQRQAFAAAHRIHPGNHGRQAALAPSLVWTVGERGILHAETGPFLLQVHPDGTGGYARYLVLRRPPGSSGDAGVLLSSGSRENIHSALSSAEQTLLRLDGN